MGAISRDARNHALTGDLSDSIAIGDVQVAGGIQGQPVGMLQLRGRGQTAVPLAALRAVAGDRIDPAVRADPSNSVVQGVADVEIPEGINYQPAGAIEV